MDIEKHRQKQQKLMVRMVERKVRSRAQQLYEARGQAEGQDLQDWYQAEAEVLGNSILAPLYRRMKDHNQDSPEAPDASGMPSQSPSSYETTA